MAAPPDAEIDSRDSSSITVKFLTVPSGATELGVSYRERFDTAAPSDFGTEVSTPSAGDTLQVTGLTEGTTYELYPYSKDGGGQSGVGKLLIDTPFDIIDTWEEIRNNLPGDLEGAISTIDSAYAGNKLKGPRNAVDVLVSSGENNDEERRSGHSLTIYTVQLDISCRKRSRAQGVEVDAVLDQIKREIRHRYHGKRDIGGISGLHEIVFRDGSNVPGIGKSDRADGTVFLDMYIQEAGR